MGLVMKTIFFIDMDGVLADFVESAVEFATGVDREIIMRGWPKGERDIPSIIKMDKDAFWFKISEGGADFWHRLRPYSWSMPMYNRLAEHGKCVVLSSPTRDPACAAGKMGWLQSFFSEGRAFRDYILAPWHNKRLLAGKNRILIDDNEGNVRDWIKAGGRAVLVPQPWNTADELKPELAADYLANLAIEKAERPWE